VKVNNNIFREYDIRGEAETDLDSHFTQHLGKALGTWLQKKGSKSCNVGRDCRLSSPRIAEALTRGLLSTGIHVTDVGLVPTPLLYYSIVNLKTDSGVMITGSHNPSQYNGFKISLGTMTLHGSEIQEIRKIIESEDYRKGTGKSNTANVKESYLKEIEENIGTPIRQKVVLDSGNGMAGMVAPELFERIGCETISLFSELDGSFPNHHPDPTVIDNLKMLRDKVKETNAIVGIAFDGDGDRIGVVDRDGTIIYGDELLILFARQVLEKHPGAKIISEVKASYRLFQDIKVHGGEGIMWKTGHSLIKSKMKESGALLAGEMSGHMFFKDRYYGFDDAIYAAARLVEIIETHKKSPGELLSDVPKSFNTPEIRVDCPDNIKFEVVERAKKEFQKKGLKVIGIDGARVEWEDGWGLIRASNTQPVLVYRFEANSDERLKEIRTLVENTVSQCLPK